MRRDKVTLLRTQSTAVSRSIRYGISFLLEHFLGLKGHRTRLQKPHSTVCFGKQHPGDSCLQVLKAKWKPPPHWVSATATDAFWQDWRDTSPTSLLSGDRKTSSTFPTKTCFSRIQFPRASRHASMALLPSPLGWALQQPWAGLSLLIWFFL